jgi:hypothetical protein
MKQILFHFLVGWMMALAVALPQTAQAARTIRVSDSCLDSMETVPVNDDLEPILIALESCPVPQTVISI